MTVFTTAPVAPLLDRLFAEADAADPSTVPSVAGYWNGLTGEDKTRLVRDRAGYADFYARMKDVLLAVSRETGDLLYMLARSRGRRRSSSSAGRSAFPRSDWWRRSATTAAAGW